MCELISSVINSIFLVVEIFSYNNNNTFFFFLSVLFSQNINKQFETKTIEFRLYSTRTNANNYLFNMVFFLIAINTTDSAGC